MPGDTAVTRILNGQLPCLVDGNSPRYQSISSLGFALQVDTGAILIWVIAQPAHRVPSE